MLINALYYTPIAIYYISTAYHQILPAFGDDITSVIIYAESVEAGSFDVLK